MAENGKTTRRTVFTTGLALLTGGALAGIAATEARAQQKVDQKVVQYQDTPKDGQHCSICVNFEAPSSCKIVAGTISPNGWCVAYAPKQA